MTAGIEDWDKAMNVGRKIGGQNIWDPLDMGQGPRDRGTEGRGTGQEAKADILLQRWV